MLHILLSHMLALNRQTLFLLLGQMYEGLGQTKTVGTLFMLMWYLYQDTKYNDGYYLNR